MFDAILSGGEQDFSMDFEDFGSLALNQIKISKYEMPDLFLEVTKKDPETPKKNDSWSAFASYAQDFPNNLPDFEGELELSNEWDILEEATVARTPEKVASSFFNLVKNSESNDSPLSATKSADRELHPETGVEENKDIKSDEEIHAEVNSDVHELSDMSSIEANSVKKTPKNKKLALRADVMNKNILRALRRESKSLFQTFLADFKFTNSRNKRIFKANLKRFADHLLSTACPEFTSKAGFSKERFAMYLGIFINVCIMKKAYTSEFYHEKIDEFNDLLYSYSHHKFYDYISVPEVTALFVVFIKDKVYDFVDNHKALACNKKSYEGHLDKILKYISTLL